MPTIFWIILLFVLLGGFGGFAMNANSGGLGLVLIIVAVVWLLGGGSYWWRNRSGPPGP